MLPDCKTMIAEVAHLSRALRYVPERRVAVDGGAHCGLWTVPLAEEFDEVRAFEPSREQMDRLLGNTCELPHALCYMLALAEGPGEVGFADGRDNSGQGHIVPGGSGTLTVALDFYRLDNVDFIKLDVEGAELMALKGAEGTLERCRPVLLVEQNGLSERYGYTDADTDGWLKKRGYERRERWNKDSLFVPT